MFFRTQSVVVMFQEKCFQVNAYSMKNNAYTASEFLVILENFCVAKFGI